jgi:hypothetical protein
MPDGDKEVETTTSKATTEQSSGARSLDAFPEEAQDYIKRLRAEAAGYRTELKDTKGQLTKFEDEKKTEAEKLAERAEGAEGRVAAAELLAARYEIAAEVGLPLKWAKRLQGSTKEELKKDAEALKGEMGDAVEAEPAGGSGFDGGVRRPVNRPKTMNGLIKIASGR